MKNLNTSDAIIADLSREDPQYDIYDLSTCKDATLLKSLLNTRVKHGLKPFFLKLQNIKETDEARYRSLTTPQEAPLLPILPTLPIRPTAPMDASTLVFSETSMPALPASATQEAGLLPRVSPWLAEYISYSKRVSPEGYKDFHLMCGLWVLSTVAARRVRVPLSDPTLTPFLMAMVARTSLFAKSTTAKAAIKLLRAAGLSMFLGADETTPQRLLYDMVGHMPTNWAQLSADEQQKTLKRLAFSGQRGWFYDEMGQLLSAMTRQNGPMTDFTGLLRKLDDGGDEYEYKTKQGIGTNETVLNPYLALLGSTTPANVKRFMGSGSEMWGDGFWARFLFVCPEPNNFITSTATRDIVNPSIALIQPLYAWHVRLGVPSVAIEEQIDTKTNKPTGVLFPLVDPLPINDVRFEDEAYTAYVAYRVALRSIIAGRVHGQDLDGSYARLPTQGLRIAALIASLNDTTISLEVWAVAQEIAEVFRANLHRLYEQCTDPIEENPVEDLLIGFLKAQAKPVTVRDILQFGPSKLRGLKSDGLRLILKGLEKDGIVAMVKEQGVKKECYSLVQ